MTLAAKNGEVSFNHKAHAADMGCVTCHGGGTPGKVALTKDSAHKLCKGCHEERKAGPVKCLECHKKQ